ncbi:hypothetical protein D3C84_873350 [compost metagenome]
MNLYSRTSRASIMPWCFSLSVRLEALKIAWTNHRHERFITSVDTKRTFNGSGTSVFRVSRSSCNVTSSMSKTPLSHSRRSALVKRTSCTPIK